MTSEWRTVLETFELTSEKLYKGFKLPVRVNQHVVAYLGMIRRGRWFVHRFLITYEVLVKNARRTKTLRRGPF
jgi:hypothetical protein